MTINCLWNKRYGPGGSTRRLHQKLRGRNRIDRRGKDKTFVRHGSAVIGLFKQMEKLIVSKTTAYQ